MSDEIQRYLFYADLMKNLNLDLYKQIEKIVSLTDWKLGSLQVGDKPVIYLFFKVLPESTMNPIIEDISKRLQETFSKSMNPQEIFIFTHPIYILDDTIFRLHGFARELKQLIYFNLTNDFVNALSAYSTIVHEIIHLLLIGEAEGLVRKYEKQVIEKLQKEGNPILELMQNLLTNYRREVKDFTSEIVTELNLDLTLTHSLFEKQKQMSTNVQDIIIIKK